VIIRYNIYRSTAPHVQCTAKNRIASVDGSVTSYTDSDARPGIRYYYVATAVAANNKESDHPSNEASEEIK
jgi:fibronectin type 3 domain-containing protein